MKLSRGTIAIGNVAGHHFRGRGDLVVARHATRTCAGTIERGYFMRRKWLANRAAFDYDPTMGWAYDHWFEWACDEVKT